MTDKKNLLALVIAIAAGNACAQGVPKVSTRDEYRTCLEEQDKFKLQLPLLQARLKEHNDDLKLLQDAFTEHNAQEAFVDGDNDTAVEQYNAKSDALNERAKQINARGDAFNKEQLAYNAQVAASNKRCAGIVVLVNDKNAVLKERAARGKP